MSTVPRPSLSESKPQRVVLNVLRSGTGDKGAVPKPLSNRPGTKLPPIPKGSRIQKRPLPGPSPASRPRISARSPAPRAAAAADPDGYIPPPRAAHTVVIKVSSGATFMSLVRRVRKALDNGPGQRQSTAKGQSLAARVAALEAHRTGAPTRGVIEDALDDVVLVATGRAIQKAVEVGGFFTREKDLVVLTRTRTLRAIDDVVVEDEDADAEDQVRVRNVSCVEVGIRWAL